MISLALGVELKMLKPVILFLICTTFGSAENVDELFPFWNLQSVPRMTAYSSAAAPLNKNLGWGEKVSVNWLQQKVDNFNTSDTRVFNQRYLKNEEHFKSGGPIFIMVGGEWGVDLAPMDRFMDEGTLYELAAENDGLLLYPEHRYYGETQPFENTLPSSLRYLSIDQALEDLAQLIRFIKSSDPRFTSSKVILTGASYSAMLASYFRIKYPELADGVWASSACVDNKVESGTYRVISGESYKKYGSQQCYDAFDEGYRRIEEMLDAGNVKPLETAFKLCNEIDVNNEKDVLHFINIVTSLIAATVAGSDPVRVKSLCDTLLSVEDPVIGISLLTDLFFQGPCLRTTYQSYIDYFNHPNEMNHPANQGPRQWFYQTCTEFGTYQTSISPNQPFGRKTVVEATTPFCGDIYGFQDYNRNTLDSNTRLIRLKYGGLTPNVTRVFYTQGEIDPWRGDGIQTNVNAETPAMIITGGSHCNDLYMWFDELPSMKEARNKIRELVKIWIQ